MPRPLLLAALLVLGVALLWWASSSAGSPPAPAPGPGPAAAADAAPRQTATAADPVAPARQDLVGAALDEGALTVRVLDADSAPVAGARVAVRLAPRDALVEGTEPAMSTDGDGVVRFRFAKACTVENVSVDPTARTTGASRWIRQRVRRGERRDVDLRVGAGARLRGRVVDSRGAPVAGAAVFAWRREPHRVDGAYSVPPERTVTADGEGRFALPHVGPEFVLSAEADGLLCLERLRGKTEQRGAIDGLELTLAAAAELRGRLLDADGAPIAGHRFGNHFGSSHSERDATPVAGVFRMRPEHNVTTTTADGGFRFTVVRDHDYLWEVQHEEHPMWRQHHGAADGELVARLGRGATVRGRVLAPDGGPAVGARVRLNDYPPRTATTDARGRFALRGARELEAKSYLAVSLPGAAIHCEQPLAAGEEVLVELRRGLPLAGRVVGQDGAPVYDALVEIEGDRRVEPGFTFESEPTWEWAHDRAETHTGVDGGFRIDDLYDGRFRLRIHDPDDPRLTHETEVRSGAEAVVVRLDRRAMRRVVFTGTAKDARTGAPIPVFQVLVAEVGDGGGWRGTWSEVSGAADGAFELPGYAPGEYLLQVKAAGYASAEQAARRYEVGEHAFAAELLELRSLDVVVVDAAGEPCRADLRVLDPATRKPLSMQVTESSSSTAIDTRADGRASLRGLPARPLVVVVTAAESDPIEVPVDLSEPRAEPLRIVTVSPPEAVDVLVLFLGHAAGADLSALGGPPSPQWARALEERDDVWLVQTAVEARLTTADGRLLSEGRVAPVDDPQQQAPPGSGWKVFKSETRFRVTSRSSQGSESEAPAPGAQLDLPGQRLPMKLVVEAEGYRRAELAVDGTSADLTRPLMQVVWLERR